MNDSQYTVIRKHFGARYGDILTSFCQISHTIDQKEILFSHDILKYLSEKIFQQKMTIQYDFKFLF